MNRASKILKLIEVTGPDSLLKGEDSQLVKYARLEPSTDDILKKYGDPTGKMDVQIYDDPKATKKYGRFMWDQSSKPKRGSKRVTINNYTWNLEWLPDAT